MKKFLVDISNFINAIGLFIFGFFETQSHKRLALKNEFLSSLPQVKQVTVDFLTVTSFYLEGNARVVYDLSRAENCLLVGKEDYYTYQSTVDGKSVTICIGIGTLRGLVKKGLVVVKSFVA